MFIANLFITFEAVSIKMEEYNAIKLLNKREEYSISNMKLCGEKDSENVICYQLRQIEISDNIFKLSAIVRLSGVFFSVFVQLEVLPQDNRTKDTITILPKMIDFFITMDLVNL